MKSCWVITAGDRCVLDYRDVPVPAVTPGMILVRVKASALNRAEFIIGGAKHGGPEKLGGTECAGIVHSVGAGVVGIKEGDRVMGKAPGSWAEFALMEPGHVMPVPDYLTWEEAASMPVGMMVAYDAMVAYGGMKAGDSVLIAGVASGVGVHCIQTAQVLGLKSIGTSGSQAKLDVLSGHGLDVAICTRRPDFSSGVMDATGGLGVNLAINLVGGTYVAECIHSLGRKGKLAIVGYVDGSYEGHFDLRKLHLNRLEIFGLSNARTTPEEQARSVSGFKQKIFPVYAERKMRPVVHQSFGFGELPVAQAMMVANSAVGKLVVRLDA